MIDSAAQAAAMNAQEQLAKTGHIDPDEQKLATAVGSGLALAGGALGARVIKEFKNQGAKTAAKGLKAAGEGISKGLEALGADAAAAKEAAERMIAHNEETLSKLVRDSLQTAQEIEREGMNKVAQVMKPDEAHGQLQLGQKALLDAVDNAYSTLESASVKTGEEVLAAIDALKQAGVTDVENIEKQVMGTADEAAGSFRRLLRNGGQYRGFGALNDALPWESAKDFLSPELFKQGTAALDHLGRLKAVVMHLESDVEAHIKNAFHKASTPTEQAKVVRKVKPDLNSAGEAKAAQKRYDLTAEQRQHNINLVESAKRRAEDALQGASPKKRAALLEDIQKMDEQLHELHNPMLKLVKELQANADKEHVYGISDPSTFALESARTRGTETRFKGMAKNFDDAMEQYHDANKLLKAAVREYDEARGQYLPLLKEIRKAWQDHTGDKFSTPAWGHHIAHPYNGKIKTPMVTQVRYNGTTEQLFGKFAKQMAEFRKVLLAHVPNTTEKIIYKVVNDQVNPQVRKQGQELLKRAGLFQQAGKHLLPAAVLGTLSGLYTQAQAAELDSKTPQEQDNYWSGVATVGFTVAGVIAGGVLIKHFNLAGALKMTKIPAWYMRQLFTYTSDGAGIADKSMGIVQGVSNDTRPYELRSLKQALIDLRTTYLKANAFTDDFKEYFSRSAAHELDGKDLSDIGKEHLEAIREGEKDLEKLIRVRAEQWRKHVANLSPVEQEKLDATGGVIRFLQKAYTDLPSMEPVDKVIAQGYATTCRALFLSKPANLLASIVCDAAGNSILQNGPHVTMMAYKDVIFDPAVQQAVERIKIAGPRGAEVQGEAETNFIENLRKNVSLAATAYRYYATHASDMSVLGIHGHIDFLDRLTDGRLPDHMLDDALGKVGSNLADFGHDPLGMEKSFVQRSEVLKHIAKFGSQPMNEGRLWKQNLQIMISNFGEGEYAAAFQRMGWLLAANAVKQQFAGHAAIPAAVTMLGLSNPVTAELTARICDALDTWSLGTQTFGYMGDIVNGDMIFSPFMSTLNSPGLTKTLEVINDVQGLLTKVGKVGIVLQSDHPEDIISGTRFDKAAQQARDAVAEFSDMFSFIKPTILGIPVEALTAVYKAVPDIVNAESYFGIKRPSMQAAPFLLKPREARHGIPKEDEAGHPIETQEDADNRMRIDAARRGLRFGVPADQERLTLLEQARAGGADPAKIDALERTTGLPASE